MTGMGTYPDFETVAANSLGPWERRVVDGRAWWVGPASLIVPGVLNGSKGPLLYTAEDTKAATPAWNDVPVVLGHPRDAAGRHISANDDGVFEKLGVGFLRNADFDGRLTAKAWLDEDWTRDVAPEVLNAIRKNEPVELSTGLGTRDEEARPGSTWNGKQGKVGYTHVARDHQPDHLAILIGQKGACSVRDGCGLGVNHAGPCDNAFCPTGEGGGVDPSCSPGEGGGSGDRPSFASKYGGTRAHYTEDREVHSSHGGESGTQIKEFGPRDPANPNAPGGGMQQVSFANRALEDLEGLAADAAHFAKTKSSWHNLAAEQHEQLARVYRHLGDNRGGGEEKAKEAEAKAQYHRSKTKKATYNEGATEDPETDDTGGGLLLRMWDRVVNAFLPNQPRSQVSGKVKRMNAGQGKGPAHEAAQRGFHGSMTHPTARQRDLGADAARQLAETGHNPPSWAVDEATWEKAKAAADKGDYDPGSATYYAVVTTIYQNMGGEVSSDAHNAVTANVVKKVGDKWRVESESGKSLGEYGSEEEAKKRLKQVEFFKHKRNSDGGDHGAVTDNQDQGDDMKTRKEKVAFLVANCDCWKDKTELLNNEKLVDDKGLDLLVANVQKAQAGQIAVNALKEISKDAGAPDDLAANAMPAFIKKKIEDAKDKGADDDEEDSSGKKKTANKAGQTANEGTTVTTKRMTYNEWAAVAPPEVVERDKQAQRVLNREKEIVVNKLTDHLTGQEKADRSKKLMALNLDELYDRLADRPAANGGRDSDDHLPLFGARAVVPSAPAEDFAANAEDQVFDPAPPAKWTNNRRTKQSNAA